MADTKKAARQRRCLHCSCMDDESRLRLVSGAGWLHEPVSGCEDALARAEQVARRHVTDDHRRLPDYGKGTRRGTGWHPDGDYDAIKRADD